VPKRKKQTQTNFLSSVELDFFEFSSSLLSEYGRKNKVDVNLLYIEVQNTVMEISGLKEWLYFSSHTRAIKFVKV